MDYPGPEKNANLTAIFDDILIFIKEILFLAFYGHLEGKRKRVFLSIEFPPFNRPGS
jgi:hypothetical protein